MESEFCEAALRYSRLGLCVIPLHPKSKEPMFKNWPEIASSDAALITRWWRQNPRANVGIATGQKSRLFVFDVDIKNGGDDTFEALVGQHGKFPSTWQQITGTGGWHMFFRYPNFPVSNAAGIFPGIDIRGNGGQVVAPPSIHPETGKRYEWDGLLEIEQAPLAEAPLWLLDTLQGKSILPKAPLSLALRIPHGVQHQTLVSMAGMMRKLGLDADEIAPSLLKVNETRCEQPGLPENIYKIAQSMMRYRPSDADLVTTANRLWRVTRAKEHEAQARVDKLTVPSVDGLTVYRSPVSDNKCVIDNLLLNGLTILSGRPKCGKSWVALQMALAVSLGTAFMGNRDVIMPGRVLYLALEESQQRTSTRMKKFLPAEDVLLQNLTMFYTLSPLLSGGAEQLKVMIEKYTPTLVIIDTFLAAVGTGQAKSDVMRSEYREIDTLHRIAETAKTAIVLIHHTRKATGIGSGLDAVAGSTGVTAAADAIWKLEKQEGGASILEVFGRDIEDQVLALQFTKEPINFGWSIIGDGESVRHANEEQQIMIFLQAENEKFSASKIASLLKMSANDVRPLLIGLLRHGMVSRDSRGHYYMSQEARLGL